MAPKIHSHNSRKPLHRVSSARTGYFYPGEAARILGLDGVDYHQLRKLLLLAAGASPDKKESRRWARFSYKDLVMVKAAVNLAGGIDTLRKGRHLRLKRVRDACASLRHAFGVQDPLSSVKLVLDGQTIVAQMDGVAFEPVSGQLILDVRQRIDHEIIDVGAPLRRLLSSEKKQIQKGRGRSKDLFAVEVPLHGISSSRPRM